SVLGTWPAIRAAPESPDFSPQRLNRRGKSGPAVRVLSTALIRRTVAAEEGSPARSRCSFGSSLRRNSSSRASPSRRMYDESPSFTAARGASCPGVPEGSRFRGSLGTTSANTGETGGAWIGATFDVGFQNLAREAPGNGAPDPTPATSTMVA